jgi:hypothetical protein
MTRSTPNGHPGMKKIAELWKTIPPNPVAPALSKASSPAKQNLRQQHTSPSELLPYLVFIEGPDPHFSDKLRIVISAAPVLR